MRVYEYEEPSSTAYQNYGREVVITHPKIPESFSNGWRGYRILNADLTELRSSRQVLNFPDKFDGYYSTPI